MKTIITSLLTLWIKLVAAFDLKRSGKMVFWLFQKTQPKKLSRKEQAFYNRTSYFLIETEVEKTKVFEMGNPLSPTVILVHGWNSNAGSMAGIAQQLVKKGFHIVLFDLPGHGSSEKKRTNLKECKIVMQAVYRKFQSEIPPSVVSHSFGSLVTAYALGELEARLSKLVYLTSPTSLSGLFEVLKAELKLGESVYQEVLQRAKDLLNEAVEDISVLDKTAAITYEQLNLIHDEYDKILPFSYSQLLNDYLANSQLHAFQKIGHYRMLWNDAVIQKLASIIGYPNQREVELQSHPSIKLSA